MPEVCCRYCGKKLSSINVTTCSNPKCKKTLYKGDIVNCELVKNKKEKEKKGEKSPIERAGEAAERVLRSPDRLLSEKRRR